MGFLARELAADFYGYDHRVPKMSQDCGIAMEVLGF
jgi:hypothetical protein